MNKGNSPLIRPRSLVRALYRPPCIEPSTALVFWRNLMTAAYSTLAAITMEYAAPSSGSQSSYPGV